MKQWCSSRKQITSSRAVVNHGVSMAVHCVVERGLNLQHSRGENCFTVNNVRSQEVLNEEFHLSLSSFKETMNSKAYRCHLYCAVKEMHTTPLQ